MDPDLCRRLEGRVAMVVGGGADGPTREGEDVRMGIGGAIDSSLSLEGAIVAVTDLSRERALTTTDILEGRGLAISADAEEPDECRRAVEIIETELGPPEIVIAMGHAGLLGFYGAGGLPLEAVTESVKKIKADLGDKPA